MNDFDILDVSERAALLLLFRKPNYADVFELAKTGRPASVRRLPAKDLSHSSKTKPFSGLLEKS